MMYNPCSKQGAGMIYAIRKDSRQDGPGLRTVVLFKGCTFSCWWCQHPEYQSAGQELEVREVLCVRCGSCVKVCNYDASSLQGGDDAHPVNVEREICIVCGACVGGCAGHARELAGRCMSVEDVLAQILPDADRLAQAGGGVTFAGGEPLMQSEFLGRLLEACKARGIHTTVDTSGYTPWEVLDSIRPLVDLFLFDIKLMDSQRHREFTGLPNDVILENLRLLSQHGHRIILRVPLIPGVTDDAGNLDALIDFAAALPHLEGVSLVPYHQPASEQYERLGRPYRAGELTEAALPWVDGDHLQALLGRFAVRGLKASLAQA